MEDQLRELAQMAARDAAYWRKKFTRMGWFNVAYQAFFLPLSVYFVTSPSHLARVCAGVLFFFCGYAMHVCIDCFRQARGSFRSYMLIRQNILQTLDQL